MRVFAYVYPGWHPIPERDEAFYPGFTEWDLVTACAPSFDGHWQPRRPAWGAYDDRDADAVSRRIVASREHGIDGWVYGFFWCRGKRVFQDALDLGFLSSQEGQRYPFALMWANRMPRRVLPVRRSDLPVIEDERRVSSDVEDFGALMQYVAERYFVLENYSTIDGAAYFSIFDTTFFFRELGTDGVTRAVALARERLVRLGLPPLHLAAIDPQPDVIGKLRAAGFDSVTHYVHLPDWKGPFLQDYAERARVRADEWPRFAAESGLLYHPSIATGWDASPRGADFGPKRPDKYPWSPVVVGQSPERFEHALRRALDYGGAAEAASQLVFIASLNEWSEGHALEPDERFGMGWLRAVRAARR